MKYISLVMIAVLIALSWLLINPGEGLSAEQHARLQQVMSEYLTVTVHESQPQATDIQAPSINTKIIDAGKKMEAEFTIAYNLPGEGGSVQKMVRHGSFDLTSENGQDWTAKIARDDSQVEFPEADAITISLADAKAAGPGEDTEAAPAEPAKEEKAADPKKH